jgi:hypothetical protein
MSRTGSRHWKHARAEWEALLRFNPAPCWRCGKMIEPGEPWHLGHLTPYALGGSDAELAPEHQRCSVVAGGRLRVALAASRRVLTADDGGQLFGTPPPISER